ncbi:hypothetical protein BU26DRAFT_551281 [Trematosphaeria pertusa]|uniref:Uncharacterized protein n=1 Tax=Trematosphaeria pertusa TaxID=390896 RepID=A0A6A6IC36_9PLEO|nr:uncharacterized protein BU26DRAFT_551281 [Trematosphaeria pertusa]KAF2247809.1 hypothetical protein BU26DRAFT_551281 [Trematosphaeria pertusa]
MAGKLSSPNFRPLKPKSRLNKNPPSARDHELNIEYLVQQLEAFLSKLPTDSDVIDFILSLNDVGDYNEGLKAGYLSFAKMIDDFANSKGDAFYFAKIKGWKDNLDTWKEDPKAGEECLVAWLCDNFHDQFPVSVDGPQSAASSSAASDSSDDSSLSMMSTGSTSAADTHVNAAVEEPSTPSPSNDSWLTVDAIVQAFEEDESAPPTQQLSRLESRPENVGPAYLSAISDGDNADNTRTAISGCEQAAPLSVSAPTMPAQPVEATPAIPMHLVNWAVGMLEPGIEKLNELILAGGPPYMPWAIKPTMFRTRALRFVEFIRRKVQEPANREKARDYGEDEIGWFRKRVPEYANEFKLWVDNETLWVWCRFLHSADKAVFKAIPTEYMSTSDEQNILGRNLRIIQCANEPWMSPEAARRTLAQDRLRKAFDGMSYKFLPMEQLVYGQGLCYKQWLPSPNDLKKFLEEQVHEEAQDSPTRYWHLVDQYQKQIEQWAKNDNFTAWADFLHQKLPDQFPAPPRNGDLSDDEDETDETDKAMDFGDGGSDIEPSVHQPADVIGTTEAGDAMDLSEGSNGNANGNNFFDWSNATAGNSFSPSMPKAPSGNLGAPNPSFAGVDQTTASPFDGSSTLTAGAAQSGSSFVPLSTSTNAHATEPDSIAASTADPLAFFSGFKIPDAAFQPVEDPGFSSTRLDKQRKKLASSAERSVAAAGTEAPQAGPAAQQQPALVPSSTADQEMKDAEPLVEVSGANGIPATISVQNQPAQPSGFSAFSSSGLFAKLGGGGDLSKLTAPEQPSFSFNAANTSEAPKAAFDPSQFKDVVSFAPQPSPFGTASNVGNPFGVTPLFAGQSTFAPLSTTAGSTPTQRAVINGDDTSTPANAEGQQVAEPGLPPQDEEMKDAEPSSERSGAQQLPASTVAIDAQQHDIQELMPAWREETPASEQNALWPEAGLPLQFGTGNTPGGLFFGQASSFSQMPAASVPIDIQTEQWPMDRIMPQLDESAQQPQQLGNTSAMPHDESELDRALEEILGRLDITSNPEAPLGELSTQPEEVSTVLAANWDGLEPQDAFGGEITITAPEGKEPVIEPSVNAPVETPWAEGEYAEPQQPAPPQNLEIPAVDLNDALPKEEIEVVSPENYASDDDQELEEICSRQIYENSPQNGGANEPLSGESDSLFGDEGGNSDAISPDGLELVWDAPLQASENPVVDMYEAPLKEPAHQSLTDDQDPINGDNGDNPDDVPPHENQTLNLSLDNEDVVHGDNDPALKLSESSNSPGAPPAAAPEQDELCQDAHASTPEVPGVDLNASLLDEAANVPLPEDIGSIYGGDGADAGGMQTEESHGHPIPDGVEAQQNMTVAESSNASDLSTPPPPTEPEQSKPNQEEEGRNPLDGEDGSGLQDVYSDLNSGQSETGNEDVGSGLVDTKSENPPMVTQGVEGEKQEAGAIEPKLANSVDPDTAPAQAPAPVPAPTPAPAPVISFDQAQLIAALNAVLGPVTTQLADLTSGMNTIMTGMGAMDAKLDDLSSEISLVKEQQRNTQVPALPQPSADSERLAKLETEQTRLADGMQELNDRVHGVQTRLESLDGLVKDKFGHPLPSVEKMLDELVIKPAEESKPAAGIAGISTSGGDVAKTRVEEVVKDPASDSKPVENHPDEPATEAKDSKALIGPLKNTTAQNTVEQPEAETMVVVLADDNKGTVKTTLSSGQVEQQPTKRVSVDVSKPKQVSNWWRDLHVELVKLRKPSETTDCFEVYLFVWERLKALGMPQDKNVPMGAALCDLVWFVMNVNLYYDPRTTVLPKNLLDVQQKLYAECQAVFDGPDWQDMEKVLRVSRKIVALDKASQAYADMHPGHTNKDAGATLEAYKATDKPFDYKRVLKDIAWIDDTEPGLRASDTPRPQLSHFSALHDALSTEFRRHSMTENMVEKAVQQMKHIIVFKCQQDWEADFKDPDAIPRAMKDAAQEHLGECLALLDGFGWQDYENLCRAAQKAQTIMDAQTAYVDVKCDFYKSAYGLQAQQKAGKQYAENVISKLEPLYECYKGNKRERDSLAKSISLHNKPGTDLSEEIQCWAEECNAEGDGIQGRAKSMLDTAMQHLEWYIDVFDKLFRQDLQADTRTALEDLVRLQYPDFKSRVEKAYSAFDLPFNQFLGNADDIISGNDQL